MEKDAALAQRIQPILEDQPPVEDTVSILHSLKRKYLKHHKVQIADAALVSAATLSNRHIIDRFLPHKAIDLTDEMLSRLPMHADPKREACDEIDRRMMKIKMKHEELRIEKVKASKDRLA